MKLTSVQCIGSDAYGWRERAMHMMVAWWVLIGHFPWYPTVQLIPFHPSALHRPPERNFLTLKKRAARASETHVSTYSPTISQNPEYIYQYQTRGPGMLPANLWDVPNSNPSHYTDYIQVFLSLFVQSLRTSFVVLSRTTSRLISYISFHIL